MIDIKLYRCNADNRQVDKSNNLTLVKDYANCMLKRETSIMDIQLSFEVVNMAELSNVNYVYIPSLNTYYYINDIIFGKGNIVTLICHEDVLMTYKNDILNLNCVIARQQNVYNQYLDDDRYRVYNYRRIQTFLFPSGFTDMSYVLTVAGG